MIKQTLVTHTASAVVTDQLDQLHQSIFNQYNRAQQKHGNAANTMQGY